MQQTHTSVLTRRLRIDGDYSTLPHEAGWASEAVFFVQAEGDHPDLQIVAEVSPDGINWLPRSECLIGGSSPMAELPVRTFGNWLRLTVTGASPEAGARILIHLSLKG